MAGALPMPRAWAGCALIRWAGATQRSTTRTASSAYTYDIAGQLKGLNHAWTGGALTASYGYDDAGALVSEALDNVAFRPPLGHS